MRHPLRAERWIASPAIAFRLLRDNAHSPISLVIDRCKLRDGVIGVVGVGQSEPHGNSRQHTRLVHALVVFVQGKRETLFFRRPKRLVQSSLSMLEFRRELLGYIFLAQQAGQIGKRSQGLDGEPRLVVLVLHRKQRAAFDPAMTNTKILRKALRVISRSQKLVCAPDVVPLLARERYVAALHCIIIHRDDQQRRRIGGNVRERIILEPGDQAGALRNFVRDFTVRTLIFTDEIDRGAGRSIIALRIEGERGPHGIRQPVPTRGKDSLPALELC